MKALITGGAGFIGSAITRALLERGDEVRVLDNLETGSRDNVPSEAEFLEGDIRDMDILSKACSGTDVVFHQAAMVSVPLSIQSPSICFEVNVQGTRNTLHAATRAGCRRVVLASSAAIYGNEPTLPKSESLAHACSSPYGYSKWLSEQDAAYYSRYCDLETVCLRYFNVFGPGQQPSSPYSGVISVAAQAILESERFTVYGTGKQSRDFVFVGDVAGAAIAAASKTNLKHEIFNVGRGEQTDILTLLQLIGEISNTKPLLAFTEERPGDVLHSVADISKLQNMLEFYPSTTMRDGLATTLSWMQNSSRV